MHCLQYAFWEPATILAVNIYQPGAWINIQCHFTSKSFEIVQIRRIYDHLVFAMVIPIPVSRHLYIESGPWCFMEVSNLTHWGRVTHICVSNLTIIGSDNGVSPGRRQAIIWTNAGILLIWTLVINFSEIFSEIHAFSFKKMHLRMSSVKWRPFCPGFDVLTVWPVIYSITSTTYTSRTRPVLITRWSILCLGCPSSVGNLPQWFIRQQETNCFKLGKLESGSLMMQSLCLLQLTYSLKIE